MRLQWAACSLSALLVTGLDAFTISPSFSCSSFTQTIRSSSLTTTKTTTPLNMMFDQLTSALSEVTKNFGGSKKQRISEKSIKSALRSVRRALLDADVNLAVADTLIEGVRKRSLGQEVLEGVTAEQQFIKAMYDELLDIMGGSVDNKMMPAGSLAVGTPEKPTVILLAGLQGAGKTTAAGKLALYLKEREVDYDAVEEMEDLDASQMIPSRLPKRERKVLLIAADVYRPAAIKQLQVLGESIGVPVFSQGTEAKPVDIVKQGLAKAKSEGFDTIIVDTAGRQVIDADLMNELRSMKNVAKPDETLLIVDAMTGQEAATLTAAFDSAVGLTGAILTKMDGDSRGGAAVSVRGVSGKPIKFIGSGEKTADLEPFYPDRMASRILGMGDVVSLVEKASAQVSDAEALRMQEKMLQATFDFDDFLKQSELVNKMGSMAGIAKMMPGIGGQINSSQIREAEERLKKGRSMICSMTKKERINPELLISDRTARSRLTRITKGSGRKNEDGLQFVREFQRMRTMMSRMQKQNMDPATAMGPGAPEEQMAGLAGNRATRRAARKNAKPRRGGGGGFG